MEMNKQIISNGVDIETELKNFKTIFDRELDGFLRAKIQAAKKISPLAGEMVKVLSDYVLRAGKRIRPALMYHTYLAMGGRQKKEALRAAMAPEFMHTFLLIHDDVMDKDDMRRGNPTVHYFYQRAARKKYHSKDAVHYGNCQAICVGDMAFSFAGEIIASSRFGGTVKDRLMEKISRIIFNTTIGQFFDIRAAALKSGIGENDVLKILEYKTGRYSVEGPIHLGAIMAGADRETLKKLSGFAVPLGIAYQIQDDILGVFGSEEETGKPVGADIKEGKKTLLAVKALELGNANQKKELRASLGNAALRASEAERARNIISETGSLEYSRNLAEKLIGEARQSLNQSGFDNQSKEFFSQVAEFIVERNH